MKSGASIFLVAFIALSASWAGFVLAPQLQLGRAAQTTPPGSPNLYPVARPGLAHQGAEVYRAMGCAYCHSQQMGQDGVKCEIILADAGTNSAATLAALKKIKPEFGNPEMLVGLPKALMQVSDAPASDAILKIINASGAKASAEVSAVGADIARGWGKRRSVAQDYAYDAPVLPGSHRVGPDLANVGAPARRPDVNWHLRHLYAPQSEVAGSKMPPYQFLFEKRKITKGSDALTLSGEFAPPAGYEIVPTDNARALAAYLVSLHTDTPLFEAPFTAPAPPPAPATNAPAK